MSVRRRRGGRRPWRPRGGCARRRCAGCGCRAWRCRQHGGRQRLDGSRRRVRLSERALRQEQQRTQNRRAGMSNEARVSHDGTDANAARANARRRPEKRGGALRKVRRDASARIITDTSLAKQTGQRPRVEDATLDGSCSGFTFSMQLMRRPMTSTARVLAFSGNGCRARRAPVQSPSPDRPQARPEAPATLDGAAQSHSSRQRPGSSTQRWNGLPASSLPWRQNRPSSQRPCWQAASTVTPGMARSGSAG